MCRKRVFQFALSCCVIAAGWGLLPLEATALSPSLCNKIRSQMQQLMKDNQRFKCAYRSPRWRYTEAHHRWCLKASSRLWQNQQKQISSMKKEIQQCRICVPYAKRSVALQLTNVTKRCNQRGSHWHARYATHFQWCKRVSRSQSDRALAQRQKSLQGCKSEGRKKRCRQHARQAVSIRAYVTGQKCASHLKKQSWAFTEQSFYQRCMSHEFGASLIKPYKAAHKTCKHCVKYADAMQKIARDTSQFKCSLRAGNARSRHLRQCLGEPYHRSHNRLISFTRKTIECRCQAYVKHALQAYQDNRKYQCGFEKKYFSGYGHGSRVFSGNRSNHMWWCKRQSTKKLLSAMRMRTYYISHCRRRRR